VHAVGEPLTEAVVHRPERVAAITALSVGDTITPETIGTVLASPDGGLRHVPDAAAVTPVINKGRYARPQGDGAAVLEHALEETTPIYARPRDVVRTRRMPLRRDRVVVIGKLSVLAVRVPAGRDDDGKRISTVRHEVVVWQIGRHTARAVDGPDGGDGADTIGGVILAAGKGTRFEGGNKLLANVEGTPIVRRAAETLCLSSVDDIIAVVGHEADRVAWLSPISISRSGSNENYAAGQSASVRTGVDAARDADWDATVFTLGDMPFVRPRTVDTLPEQRT